MEYLIIALAVFCIVRLIKVWVEAPGWLWSIAQIAISAAALLPWSQDWFEWYSPFAAAGLVTFLQLLENLLIAKCDEALAAIMRRR